MAAEYGGTTPISRLGDLFAVLASMGLANILDTKSAKQFYQELRGELAEDRRHLQADPEQPIYLVAPDLKNAALYVDLDASGKVLSPSNRVDECSARANILGLEYFLAQYAALPIVVGDDQHWRDFAERVRHGLADTDTSER